MPRTKLATVSSVAGFPAWNLFNERCPRKLHKHRNTVRNIPPVTWCLKKLSASQLKATRNHLPDDEAASTACTQRDQAAFREVADHPTDGKEPGVRNGKAEGMHYTLKYRSKEIQYTAKRPTRHPQRTRQKSRTSPLQNNDHNETLGADNAHKTHLCCLIEWIGERS